MTFTREQINAIEVGKTKLAWSRNGIHFGEAQEVVKIFAKEEDTQHRLFVCGYLCAGAHSQVSFSIKEGNALDATLYQIIQGE